MKRRKHHSLTTPSRCRGSSLIEALITMLVMALGLMGVAQMQISGVRNQSDAYQRSLAIQQVNDIAERMRANAPGVAAGNYVIANAAGTDPGCILTGCTSAQVAQYDAFIWVTSNNIFLPNAVSSVAGPDPDGRYAIALSWTRRDGSADQVVTTWSP